MKIILLDLRSKRRDWINRDLAGGFGSWSTMGNSLGAMAITLVKRNGVRLPVLSLGYLAAIFHNAGWAVEARSDAHGADADIVIIASSIVGYKDELKAAAYIKKNSNALVGFIGPFAAEMPDVYSGVYDFIIKGEPEEIAMRIAQGYVPKGVVESKPLNNLDILPFPKWDVFPVKLYSYFPTIAKTPFLSMQTSRGCPLSCYYYCPYTVQQGRTHRSRTPDNVVAEIEYLKNKFSIQGLLFRDPIFTCDKTRVIAIAEKLIEKKIKIEWACETHLNTLDKDLLDILYRAGLRAMNVGIEGINKEILGKMHRIMIDQRHREDIIAYCEAKGIKISAFYILGSPWDTKETMIDMMRYAKKLNTSVAQFTISTPYPGTQYYEAMKDKLLGLDWEMFNGFNLVFDHPHVTRKDLLQLKEKAFVSYYFRVKWIFKFIANNLFRR